MKRTTKWSIFLIYLFICSVNYLNAGTLYSINKKELNLSNDSKTISFLMGGHFYGAPGIHSIYPSSSVTMNIDKINSLKPSFLILLGDNYRCLDSISVNNFKQLFLDKINFPIFNAVGNHDLMPNQGKDYAEKDYINYERHFGKTYYKFQVQKSLFLILDSEQSNGNIDGKQLHFFNTTIEELSKERHSIKQVFICTHQDIWQGIQNNFHSDIQPALEKISNQGMNVFLFSGDMSRATSELCSKRSNNIQFIHTHISDNRNDKILKIDIDSSQTVTINAISLEKLTISDIPTCPTFTIPQPQPITLKDIIEGLKGKFLLKDFWYGFIFSLMILFTFIIGKIIWKKII